MKNTNCEVKAILDKLHLTHRQPQLELACWILDCLRRAIDLIAEAPTGVGKSFAYLIPAILYSIRSKKKVIISTASKALQKQLVNRDLPKLQQVLPFSFHMSLGSQNYFCDKRMFQGNQLGLFVGCEDAHVLKQIAALRLRNPAATFLDCDFHVPESLKRRINRDSQACMSKCPMQAQCAYKLSAQKQRDANIIITNHHKVLHLVKRGSRDLDSVGAIVFDECHRLEDIATAVFGEHLDSKEVMTTIKELYDARSTDGILSKIRIARDQKDLMTEAAKSVTKILYDLYETAQRDKDNVGKEDEEHLRQLKSSLERFGTLLHSSKVEILQLYSARITGFINTIDIILKEDREVIRWKKVTNRSLAYAATPLSVSKFLQQRLFNPNKITTIHVSATISTGKKEKMAFYKKTTGIINAEEMTVESPYDYRKQAAIYIPRDMPAPGKKEYLPAAIEEIGKIITHFGGRTLILFTSLRAMNETCEILRAKFAEFTFLKQGEGSTESLISKFKRGDKAVLLGAGSFWEGIDIRGNCKKCVIIMRLPFDVPSNPVVVAHREHLKKRDSLLFRTYLIPRAIIRLLQGFGRLIRSENDTGVAVILDSRIDTKGYGKRFLDALPNCQRINNITDFPAK